MIRAVIDTNVLVRYLLRPSAAIRELIEERWLGGEVQVVTAPELLDELMGVLAREKLRALVLPQEAQALLDAVRARAEILPGLGDVPTFTRDAKDDKFVACALAGNAVCVITLDLDLLILRQFGATRMVTPGQFLEELGPRPDRESHP